MKRGSGDIHIHLVIMDTERYSEFIILRDYLLHNDEEAKEYSNLKKKIIDEGITDRRVYKAMLLNFWVGLKKYIKMQNRGAKNDRIRKQF